MRSKENAAKHALPTSSRGLQNCHPFLLWKDYGSVALACTDWFICTGTCSRKAWNNYETTSMPMVTIAQG